MSLLSQHCVIACDLRDAAVARALFGDHEDVFITPVGGAICGRGFTSVSFTARARPAVFDSHRGFEWLNETILPRIRPIRSVEDHYESIRRTTH